MTSDDGGELREQVDLEVPVATAPGEVEVGPDGVPSVRRATGRHRQHVFPGRGHAIKVLYADEERAAVAHAAELTGLRPSSFVAAAALLVARGLVRIAQPPATGDATLDRAGSALPGEVPAGQVVTVSWSAGEDQELLAELIQARLALRRYGVNVNQAAAALNSGGHAPVWLEQAVAGSNRAVARVDEATLALTRRMI